jgi:hypothetical protein
LGDNFKRIFLTTKIKKMNDFIEGLKVGLAGFACFMLIPLSVAIWVIIAVALDDLKQFLNNKNK